MSVIPVGFGSRPKHIEGKSLRFRGETIVAKSYLHRAFAGNIGTATISFWMKRGQIGTTQAVFGWSDNNFETSGVYIGADDKLDFYSYYRSYVFRRQPANLLRDVTGFYHVVCVYDMPNPSADDRVKIYINGKRITAFSGRVDPPQNSSHTFQNNRDYAIGVIGGGSGLYQFDGLLSEFHLVDGLALTAADFGTTDSDGIWVPKAYTGAHGAAGFYLPLNRTDFEKDQSGAGNDFAQSGFSLINDHNYDLFEDYPTVTFPTLNPLNKNATAQVGNANMTLKGANAIAYSSVNFPSTGKYYFEAEVTQYGSLLKVGICNTSPTVQREISYMSDGKKVTVAATGAYGAAYGDNAVIGVAVDCDGGSVTFYKDNVSQGLIGFAQSSLASSDIVALFMTTAGADNWAANFGQRPFKYPPPLGHKALSTANTPSGGSIKTSGTFTGNANADGPYVWLNGSPETMTINGNAVTWGLHADRTAGGFKVRTAAATHNAAGPNTFAVTVAGKLYGDIAHTPNSAQSNL